MNKPVSMGLAALVLATLASPLLAQQITDEQRSAIKSSCRGDYSSVCSGVPTGGMPALQCLQQHSQQVSAGCQKALAALPPPSPAAAPATGATAASPAAAPTAAPATAAGAAATGAAPAGTASSPRAEARVLRSECGADFQKLCAGVGVGGGRGAACLRAHASDLSPRCSSALSSMAPK